MLTLNTINQALSNRPSTVPSVNYADIVIDSRQAQQGSLFVALPGERMDGHDFVQSAFDRGAKAALVTERIHEMDIQACYWQPGAPLAQAERLCIVVPDTLIALQAIARAHRAGFPACRVIGITGSVGKTTTKELVAAVLRQRYVTLKSPGNRNNEIGLPLTVLEMDERCERAVLEMGMYDLGEIALLCRIARPLVGVVTNVQPIHLERLGSMDRIAQAKAELVQALPPEGLAILNGDDPRVRAMADQTEACQTLFYGLQPTNDLWADKVQGHGLSGISARFHWQDQTMEASLPLHGVHGIWGALAAAAVGLADGLKWDRIIAGLQQPDQPLRMRILPGMQDTTVLDDSYNAGPSSNEAALRFAASLRQEGSGKRVIAVLGDMLEMGQLEEAGHRQVGQMAAELAQRVLTVGPRARWIGEAAINSGMPATHVRAAMDNAAAIDLLKRWIEPGDLILVKGSRGMAMEEIVAALQS